MQQSGTVGTENASPNWRLFFYFLCHLLRCNTKPRPTPAQGQARFFSGTNTKHPLSPCPQGPTIPKTTGTWGLWGGCPFTAHIGTAPCAAANPRHLGLTPTPQSAPQQLLHFPFPPRASCLSRSIPQPRWRAVIRQPEVGEKRNILPKKQDVWCEYPDPANPRARLEPAACKQQPRVSLSNRARSSPRLAGTKKGLFLSVKDSSLG